MTETNADVLDYSSAALLGDAGGNRRRWIQWLNIVGTFAALLLVFAYFSLTTRRFATLENVETMARQTTIVAIAGMGVTLVIVAGGINLSIGSLIALTTVVIALLLERSWNPWLAAIAGIAAGALCGFLNGTLITRLKVVPFIVTLGTLLIIRGVAKGMAGNQKIDVTPQHLGGLDKLLAALEPGEGWKIFPPGVWIMLLLVILTAWLLRYTRFGRHVVAVGSNEQTARLCGINVERTKAQVYLLDGLLIGVAGLMQFSRLTVGDPTVAVGLELDCIAAAVIGGASLSGGEGSALGTLIGAAIMTTIRRGSSYAGWPNWRQEIITGVIIILAVALDRLRQRRASANQG